MYVRMYVLSKFLYACKLQSYKQLTSHKSDYSHALRIRTVCTQDTYCMHSGYVLYALRIRTVCAQDTYCMRSGYVLYALRIRTVCTQDTYCMRSILTV